MAGDIKRAGIKSIGRYGKQKKQEVLPEFEIQIHSVKPFADKFVDIIPL
jgi:hypothetical protein